MRFRPSAVDQIARMICGDSPLPFPYRSSSYLTAFFAGIGLDYIHRGETRNPWARSALEDLNSKSPEEGSLPSPELVAVLEELVNPDYFASSRPGEVVDHEQALERLNRVLNRYNLEMADDRKAGRPRLRLLSGEFISTATTAPEVKRTITFVPSVFKLPKGTVQQDLVSVMMPFSAGFKSVYATIQASCAAAGLRCLRADDIWANSTIIQDVFDLIFVSHIVIVDFTGKNSNVMYETGIAHALGKHVVPITQSMDDVPFDLQSHRVLKYLPNREGLEDLKAGLSKRLATLVEGHSWE